MYLVVDLSVVNPFDFFLEPEAERYPFDYPPGLRQELAPYREVGPAGPLLQSLLRTIDRAAVRPARARPRGQEPSGPGAGELRDTEGTGGPDERRDAGHAQRIVPRFVLAA